MGVLFSWIMGIRITSIIASTSSSSCCRVCAMILQTCLDLETCDAKVWMMKTLQNEAKHDSVHPERFLTVRSPHQK